MTYLERVSISCKYKRLTSILFLPGMAKNELVFEVVTVTEEVVSLGNRGKLE